MESFFNIPEYDLSNVKPITSEDQLDEMLSYLEENDTKESIRSRRYSMDDSMVGTKGGPQYADIRYDIQQDQLASNEFFVHKELVHSNWNSSREEILKYTCAICIDILKRPTALSCGHMFCHQCLNQASTTLDSCPLCRRTQDLDPKENTEHKVLGTYLYNQMTHTTEKEEKCLFDDYLNEEERKKALTFRRQYQYWRRKYHFGARGEFSSAVTSITVDKKRKRSIAIKEDKVPVKKPCKVNDSPVSTSTTCSIDEDIAFEDLDAIASEYFHHFDVEKCNVDHVNHLYDDITNYMMPCPLNCGTTISANSIHSHLDETNGDCPNSTIFCPFSYAGCTVRLQRKFIRTHLACPSSMQFHLALLTNLNRVIKTNVAPPCNGPRWELIQPEHGLPPSPRYDHSVVVYQRKMFVLGGVTKSARENDLHYLDFQYSPPKWITPTVNGSFPLQGVLHQAVVIGSYLYVLGGSSDGVYLTELHKMKLTGPTYTWKTVNVQGQLPSMRYWHTVTVHGSHIYLFGGYNNGKRFNDLYQLDVRARPPKWRLVEPEGTPPSVRSSHTAVVFRDQLVIYGGYDGKSRKNDTCILDLSSSPPRWISLISRGKIPTVRYNHSCTLIQSCMYIFGGNGCGLKNDLYMADLEQCLATGTIQWTKLTTFGNTPCKRYWHRCVTITNRELIVFGGYSGTQRENDTYRLMLT